MSTTNLVLLLWAAACVAVGYAAGRYWKASKFWTWVDPIYYPLAILGIVLLFFSNDSARVLADLRYELADTEQQIADLRAAEPPSTACSASSPRRCGIRMARTDCCAVIPRSSASSS